MHLSHSPTTESVDYAKSLLLEFVPSDMGCMCVTYYVAGELTQSGLI